MFEAVFEAGFDKLDPEEKGQVNRVVHQDKACQKKKSKNVFGDACEMSANINLKKVEEKDD